VLLVNARHPHCPHTAPKRPLRHAGSIVGPVAGIGTITVVIVGTKSGASFTAKQPETESA
jgi:hypothetical protein